MSDDSLVHAFLMNDGHAPHPFRISLSDDESITCDHCRKAKGLNKNIALEIKGKALSNPFSTGSGGARFEANIHASFLTLMLSGGYAPCLPTWPIVEIKLQGAVAGYGTDDIIVFVENQINNDRRRLLGQVKNSISITAASQVFGEVIQAAWNDFNNSDVFTKGKDVIALITGPISATDSGGVNGLLEQARHTRDADEFLIQVARANFCSDIVRNKLAAFKTHLKAANGGKNIEDKDLYEFLKHFHLLGYDLAKKGSVISSLLQSHIAQFNKDMPDKIWYQILSEVQNFNQAAGSITLDSLPDDLVEHFREPEISYIPKALVTKEVEDDASKQPVPTDWSLHKTAPKLATANLIGGWDENSTADIEVVEQIIGDNYKTWVVDLQATLFNHDCPLSYKNGLWIFKDRLKSWLELGCRLFDNQLDTLKATALEVLQINDPSLDLPAEERFSATIRGKKMQHSSTLREGLTESLALIGSRADSLTHCSLGKADAISSLSVRELFEGADWIRWGSLSSLLPTIAEASPSEFLSVVENAIAAAPSPFDKLFEQESTGVFGRNYISGLLWALEGIAWEEVYLSRATVVLAEVASHDPGGNWANRPGNTLTDIFLPWQPHTLATVQKRQAALKTICVEQPEVAWNLLLSLLPNKQRTTSGTHNPKWRNCIPADRKKGVTREEFLEQSRFCSELIVEQAQFDTLKLSKLVENYDHLSPSASKALKERLLSEKCLQLPEQKRMTIWEALCRLIARHRRFPEAEWSLEKITILELKDIAIQLAPKTPSLLHKRLFSDAEHYLYEGTEGLEEQRENLFQLRKKAVQDILGEGDLSQVLEFSWTVSYPNRVGEILADLDRPEFDTKLLPAFLNMENQKIWSLVASYVWRRNYMDNYCWFDDINKTGWNVKQLAILLCALPFEKSTWDKVNQLLGDCENEYWEKTSAHINLIDDDTDYALEKLIKYGRPDSAINGLASALYRKKVINPDLAYDALIALTKNSDPSTRADSHHIVEIIEALQENSSIDQDRLFNIEWAFLSLLDHDDGRSPITLEYKLSTDPTFFCELIQLVFRAEGTKPNEEPSEQQRNIAANAYDLLSTWSIVPGSQSDGDFAPDAFIGWLNDVEKIVKESGHYDVAMVQLGDVLVNSPKEPDGLWIHPVIAEAMNNRERSSLRNGYRTGIYNSRGAHWVDPEAKTEIALAEKYRRQANEVENEGYQRFATTLRDVATTYDREAERVISNSTY